MAQHVPNMVCRPSGFEQAGTSLMTKIVEMQINRLALIIRDAPHAVAIERDHLEQLLATYRASVEATANAALAHQQQLDGD